ncbi:MAG: alpha/beta hydrolase [Acidimicrobiia bacterium]|nr:alpha/beta hydrolase [Acidimicrobiia bacterium]
MITADPRVVDAGGVELAYVEAGDADPPIVLVHGFTGAKEDYGDHLEWLGREQRAIAFDNRGHGQSARTDSYSLDLVRGDIAAFADALGLGRFVLVGHSMGGFVAQQYALAAPERLIGLVLMGTGPGAPRIDADFRRTADAARRLARDAGMEVLLQVQQNLVENDPAAAALASESDVRLRRERPGYVDFCDAKFVATDPVAYDELLGDILDQEDRTGALGGLDVETLVVVGDEDRTFRKAARRLADAIPGARFEEIAGAGHSPQFEAPAAWRDAVGSFLRELR